MRRTVTAVVAVVLLGTTGCGEEQQAPVAEEPVEVETVTVTEDPSGDDGGDATESAAPDDGGVEETPTDDETVVGQVGDTVQLETWDVTLVEFVPDAGEQIAAANEFNEPAAEGEQYVLVNLEATYTGDETAAFWADVLVKLEGADGRNYGTETCFASTPSPMFDEPEVRSGGAVAGDQCFLVPAEALDGQVAVTAEGSFDLTPTVGKWQVS